MPPKKKDEVVAGSVDTDFQKTDAGSSLTAPITAGLIKKGTIALLKGAPCKVDSVTTSKTGKHGHAKATIIGYDIFNNKRYEDACPTSHNMEEVNVANIEYTLLDIEEDGHLNLLSDAGEEKNDLKLPDDTEKDKEVAKTIRELSAAGKSVTIVVLSAMNNEKVIGCKELQD